MLIIWIQNVQRKCFLIFSATNSFSLACSYYHSLADNVDDLQKTKQAMSAGNYDKVLDLLDPQTGAEQKGAINSAATKLSVHLAFYGDKIPAKPQQLKTFIKTMQKHAVDGDPESQRIMGDLYYKGVGFKRDFAEAKKWYELAAAQYAAGALNNLGYLYLHGMGVEQDYSKALSYFQNGADRGNPDAMNNLGFLYARGLGVKLDYNQAADLFNAAYKLGSMNAASNLGWLYQNGYGLSKNYKKAIELYKIAAEANVHAAQYNLGYMHQFGYGTPRNMKQTSEYYLSAAGRASPDTQSALGFIQGRAAKQAYLQSQTDTTNSLNDQARSFIHWDLLEVPD